MNTWKVVTQLLPHVYDLNPRPVDRSSYALPVASLGVPVGN